MKKRFWKQTILVGMACMMLLGVQGCGDSKEPADTETEQGAMEEQSREEQGTGPEDAEENSGPADGPGGASDPASGTGTGGGSASRKEGNENLEGNIKELGDGQFTVTVIETEETEDGVVMAAPAPGADDSDFAHATVTYDGDTDIYVRTIYDNGARYEDADGSAEDLSVDDMVAVWGTYDGDGTKIHADQIQIDRFVR